MQVTVTVNGRTRTDDVEPRLLLAHYLREVCDLRATNIGCDTTSCGACTVIVDGLSVKSCTVLTPTVDGSSVTTLEGLAGAAGEELGVVAVLGEGGERILDRAGPHVLERRGDHAVTSWSACGT